MGVNRHGQLLPAGNILIVRELRTVGESFSQGVNTHHPHLQESEATLGSSYIVGYLAVSHLPVWVRHTYIHGSLHTTIPELHRPALDRGEKPLQFFHTCSPPCAILLQG